MTESADASAGAALGSPFCDQCGDPLTGVTHVRCAERQRWEPPRYCAQCRRRMVVQVTPLGWVARCSQHGELRSAP